MLKIFIMLRFITIYNDYIYAEIIYFDRPGHYPFTVPPYNRLRVSLWGGGGTGMYVYVCMYI